MYPRPCVRVSDTVAFSQLAWLGPDDGGFQGLNRLLTLIQASHGIDVEIHTQAMTELIGHQLWDQCRLGGRDWHACAA